MTVYAFLNTCWKLLNKEWSLVYKRVFAFWVETFFLNVVAIFSLHSFIVLFWTIFGALLIVWIRPVFVCLLLLCDQKSNIGCLLHLFSMVIQILLDLRNRLSGNFLLGDAVFSTCIERAHCRKQKGNIDPRL